MIIVEIFFFIFLIIVIVLCFGFKVVMYYSNGFFVRGDVYFGFFFIVIFVVEVELYDGNFFVVWNIKGS